MRSSPRTLLLLADDWAIAEIVREVMAEEGYAVMWCRDGDEAVDAAGRLDPDALLLDLPGSAGERAPLLRRLRERARGPGVPVVLLSVREDQLDDEERSLVDGTVAAPFDLDWLVEEVGRVAG